MPKLGSKHKTKTLEMIYGRDTMWRRLCLAYIKYGDMESAGREVYGNTIKDHRVKATRVLHHPECQAIMKSLMEHELATPDKAAEIIGAACNATNTFARGEEMVEVPDHRVRLKAADMIIKVFDAYPRADQTVQNEPSKHLHIHLSEPREVREFIVMNGRMPTPDERRLLVKET